MKIAIISDSHYNDSSIKAIKNYIKDADVLIHCGDGVPDVYKIAENFNGEVYGVQGNCDFSNEFPNERIIEIEGKRIFVCHGHFYNVKNGYNNIFFKAKELGVDIALFGHSHLGIILDNDEVLLMNPGSISLPYGDTKRSLGFIDIKNDKIIDAYLKEFVV